MGLYRIQRQGQSKESETTMKRLMKSAILLASVGAALCFVGCNSVGDKPEGVVIEVLKKMQSGTADLAFLNKYCEEDTAKLFSGLGSAMIPALEGATFTVANVFVDDDVAVVKINQEGGERPGESYYDAQKINGQWKIKINKEAHSDYYCISQKSIFECVEAFKAAVVKDDNVKYRDRCAKEFLDELEIPPAEELDEIRKALKGLKVKGHKKSIIYDDSVEVECEMPGKDGKTENFRLILKYINGKWMCAKDC